MTREEAKEWLPLLEAYAEGKTIEVLTYDDDNNEHWTDAAIVPSKIAVEITDTTRWRVKPEPTYRPFKDCEELVAEYCKRFGVERKPWEMPQIWMRYTVTNSNIIHLIYGMGIDGVKVDNATASLKYLFESYAFLDGSPCGVEEANKC